MIKFFFSFKVVDVAKTLSPHTWREDRTTVHFIPDLTRNRSGSIKKLIFSKNIVAFVKIGDHAIPYGFRF